MKRFLKISLWCLLGLILVVTFVYLFVNSRTEPTVYELVSPSEGKIEHTTVLTGKIEPRDEIQVKPQISGIISEIAVEAGDMVNVGDVIAKIKVVPDESQLASAQNRVNTARLELSDAETKYNRDRHLYDSKVISREDFENTTLKYERAKEELNAALDAYSIVKEGISTSNASQSNTLVRATITGLVLDVPVKVGSSVIQANTFNDGTTVAIIANMNDLIFKGSVDETEVGSLYVGQPMDITVGAIPDFSSRALVEYISPKGTETNGTNTFELKAAIDPADAAAHTLRAGYSANATVSLDSTGNTVTIPEVTVEFVGDSTFVYILRSTDGGVQQFDRQYVELGISDGVNIEVKSQLPKDAKLRGLPVNN